jgi:diaminohydroxyphosphoribosylaminopyrimidine deaminase / 5-amino-6-(5-phosphoribosylamino)uracil reductase
MVLFKQKTVIVGMTDLNPIVFSKGIERLQQEGIEVVTGIEENLCRKLNEFCIHRMLTGKPFVALRYIGNTSAAIEPMVNGAHKIKLKKKPPRS